MQATHGAERSQPSGAALSESALVAWMRHAEHDESARLSAGYQGSVYLYEADGRKLIVKAATGHGPMRWLRLRMLRNEFAAYRRLEGLDGVPRCFGLVAGRYLVLEYVAGPNARDAQSEGLIDDLERFYDATLEVIHALHARGVAHADLKKRNNILLAGDGRPVLIDLGMAVLRRPGFHPWNHYVWRVGCRLDHNAWIKHKYNRDYEKIAPHDERYFRPMLYERVWRWARARLRRPKKPLRRTAR